MTGNAGKVTTKAAELRAAFDRSFASAPEGPTNGGTEPFLAIRIGTQPYAVAHSDVAALLADKRVMPLPSTASELLGVAGLRGAVVPIFSLAALLGLPTGEKAPRWILLATGEQAGFAFDAFEGHLDMSDSAIAVAQDQTRTATVRAGIITTAGLRPILSIVSLLDQLLVRLGRTPTPMEE